MTCPKCKKDDHKNMELYTACGVPIKPTTVLLGSKICFGAYDWYVLDKQNDRMLIITEKVIERCPYHHEKCEITWETSNIRKYLNDEFYNSFSEADRARIVEVTNENPNNPWYGTSGGNPTKDTIFLLSINEVTQYMGADNSIHQLANNQTQWINDNYNAFRKAKYGKSPSWWWLRSSGHHDFQAIYINSRGHIAIGGDRINRIGGVRPALWLKNVIIEVTPDDLPKCSSFWNINDSRLIERKVFAYKMGNEYVGGCALFVRYEKCGHFSHFDVRSDLRGNGIGSRILEFAIKYLKDIGMEQMRLHVFKDNLSAIRLYERYGFKYTEDITPEKIVMIKSL